MRAWCDQCEKYIECSDEYSRTESLELNGIRFNAIQSFGVCPFCDGEVWTNAMIDANTHRAHNAYRRAVGSITSEEIRHILKKYDIGAQPLSLLLGWGANTIERQMKHTIPDREHANRLRSLNDPREMYRLLSEKRERITPVAYNKAIKAVSSLLQSENNVLDSGLDLCKALYGLSMLNAHAKKYFETGCYQTIYKGHMPPVNPAHRYVFNH